MNDFPSKSYTTNVLFDNIIIIFITCLLDIVLILDEEILFWSLVEVKGLTVALVAVIKPSRLFLLRQDFGKLVGTNR